MIGIGEPATLTETTGALHAFNIPLISVTPHPLGPSYSNVLTTAPDMAGQARVSTLLLMLSFFLPSSNAQCGNSRNFLTFRLYVKSTQRFEIDDMVAFRSLRLRNLI